MNSEDRNNKLRKIGPFYFLEMLLPLLKKKKKEKEMLLPREKIKQCCLWFLELNIVLQSTSSGSRLDHQIQLSFRIGRNGPRLGLRERSISLNKQMLDVGTLRLFR